MLRAVADTHTLIWHLYADQRLSSTAQAVIEETAANGDQIAFSSITLAEIIYLIEKSRIPSTTFTRILNAL